MTFFLRVKLVDPLMHGVSKLDGSSIVEVIDTSSKGPRFNCRNCQTFAYQFFSALLQIFVFMCCFATSSVSSLEATPTTEASQGSQESRRRQPQVQQIVYSGPLGKVLGTTLAWPIGESQNGKVNCSLCGVKLSTKGAILKHHV